MAFNQSNDSALDLSEVGHIERIQIGKYNQDGVEDDAKMERQIEKLNSLLSGCPKGVLIGKDNGFRVIKMGEHTIVAQYVSYHVGFRRKPKHL